MANRRGTPIWVTCGCGCLGLAALAVGGMVAAGFFGASAFKGYVEDMKDPIARSAKASEILGAEQLPEGYVAQLYFQIPWLLDVVVLSDGEPMEVVDDEFELETETLGEHTFVYFFLRQRGIDHDELERMLRGDSHGEGNRVNMDFEFDSDRELARGSFEVGDQKLSYVSHRGELELDDGDIEGVYSQVLIECPNDDLTRVAVWFQRDDDGEASGAAEDDSPTDEAALRRFMVHFDVCGA